MIHQQFPATSRTALKEWAVACEALGRGDQIVLLRKGGISEEGKHFRIEHDEFLLFPTFEHQRTDLVKPFARAELGAVLAGRGATDQVELRYWATVAEVFDVLEVCELEALAPMHLWSDEYARERLRWKPLHPLQVVVLRVYLLPQPTILPILPTYGGCKSWLTLAEPISVQGARAVLRDPAFEAQQRQVRALLGHAVEVGR